MRIAIVGAGAVGLYAGSRLASCGRHNVCFLLRSDYDAATQRGVKVESPQGNCLIPSPWAAREASQVGEVDWVICALKTTAVSPTLLDELVAPLVGANTRIQLLMNGIGMEEKFGERFGAARVFGGLVFGGLTRLAPAHVRHEGLPFEIRGGHFQDTREELMEAMTLWKEVPGVIFSPQPCLLRAQWQKLCWNFTFNGLSVLGGCCGVDKLLASPALHASCGELIRELVTVANADLLAHDKVDAATMNPEETIATLIKVTQSMKGYKPSTAIDFIKGNKMEVSAIFGEPLRRADTYGVDVPILRLVAGLLGLHGETQHERVR